MLLKKKIKKIYILVSDLMFRNNFTSIIKFYPIGLDPLYDIIKCNESRHNWILFDVGANVGQSALRFNSLFKNAKIYSFEPVSSTYNELQKNCKKNDNIQIFNLALGARKDQTNIKLSHQSLNNSIVQKVQDKIYSDNIQLVTVDTLDNISDENGIRKIDLLKIDTEGYDLEVLKGARSLLKGKCIKYVLCEVGFNNEASKVRFYLINEFLRPFGFRFVGLYETVRIGFGKLPIKYSNALFQLLP